MPVTAPYINEKQINPLKANTRNKGRLGFKTPQNHCTPNYLTNDHTSCPP